MRRKDNFLFPDISREKALATSPSNHKLLSCVESKSALPVKVLKYDELGKGSIKKLKNNYGISKVCA